MDDTSEAAGNADTVLTDANKSLNTLIVKHFNDLLGSQTSERGRDEVIFSYVGRWGSFCIHLVTIAPISYLS